MSPLPRGPRKLKVYLVIQNAWDTSTLTMPLALGYLKSYALADAAIKAEVEIKIFNYSRRASVSQMAVELFDDPPDILGFSILGWNYTKCGQIAETFRQINPRGWCVFGGNHAAYQAERVFRMNPWVNFVVNGEGEVTFRDLVLAFMKGRKPDECCDIPGLSIRLDDGSIVTTVERERLRDLDVIPSPFLTGAIPMFGPDGNFLYDVGLMETNRGCPYKCSFCYWGGAVGQKVFSFSRERLRAELEFFARNKVENICLCDANFGMLKADLEFVEDLVEMRSKFTYPRDLVCSWAKNKSETFYQIVKILKDTGFHSDFTLSLQTLNSVALEAMHRKNMKVNDFEDLCLWLDKAGMTGHAELIWGVPGETCESFMEGYDRVAKYIARVATYPLLILPNTDYSKERDKHGLITVRDTASDYEFCLSHNTISLKDNRRMHHFLFWARVIAEHQIFRHIWRPLRELAGVKQSEVLLSLDRWVAQIEDPVLMGLSAYLRDVVENLDITRVTNAVIYIYLQEEALAKHFRAWWKNEMLPRVPAENVGFFEDLFSYDWATRPYHDVPARTRGAKVVEIHGEHFYVRENLLLDYDVPTVLDELRKNGATVDIVRRDGIDLTLYYRTGFSKVADSHEFVARYGGKTRTELDHEADLRARRMDKKIQPHVVGLVGSDLGSIS